MAGRVPGQRESPIHLSAQRSTQAQVLTGNSDPTNLAFQESLHELGEICGVKQMLPKSCTLSDPLLDISLPPTSGYVCEGIIDGSRVRTKHIVRVRPGGKLWKLKQVRSWHLVFPSSSANETPDLLPGGREVETLDTPERRPPSGCHQLPSPTHLGLDVRRRPGGMHHEPPRCRQTRSCAHLSHSVGRRAYPRQLSDVAEGLTFLHSCNVVHGDLKGVRSSL